MLVKLIFNKNNLLKIFILPVVSNGILLDYYYYYYLIRYYLIVDYIMELAEGLLKFQGTF